MRLLQTKLPIECSKEARCCNSKSPRLTTRKKYVQKIAKYRQPKLLRYHRPYAPFTLASSLETASGPLGGAAATVPLTASFSRRLFFGRSGLGARRGRGELGCERTNYTVVSLSIPIISDSMYDMTGLRVELTELAALRRAIKLACTTSS